MKTYMPKRLFTRYAIAVAIVMILSVAICSPAPLFGDMGHPTRISPSVLRLRQAEIACVRPNSDEIVGKIRPAECELSGLKGAIRKKVKTPVEHIKWVKWGQFQTRGALGSDSRNGSRIRLIAYRRVRCADGRVFYQYVSGVYLETGNIFYIQLPVCTAM